MRKAIALCVAVILMLSCTACSGTDKALKITKKANEVSVYYDSEDEATLDFGKDTLENVMDELVEEALMESLEEMDHYDIEWKSEPLNSDDEEDNSNWYVITFAIATEEDGEELNVECLFLCDVKSEAVIFYNVLANGMEMDLEDFVLTNLSEYLV